MPGLINIESFTMSASQSLLFLVLPPRFLWWRYWRPGNFVLRQGVLGRHITPIIGPFCILSDALMIGLGVVGLGALLDAAPWFIEVFRYVVVAFWRGSATSRRSVFHPACGCR